MSLTIVHTESSYILGGQERRVLAEAIGMQARGYRSLIVAPPGSAILPKAQEAGLATAAMRLDRRALAVSSWRLARWLREVKPDIVNSHGSPDSWVAALASRLWRAPGRLIRTRHISTPVELTLENRWLYRRATTHLITTGESIGRALAARVLVPASGFTSIPTGVDLARFCPRPELRFKLRRALDLADSAEVIGMVAMMRPEKGHHDLLAAFQRLAKARPSAILVLAGSGPVEASVRSLVGTLGLAGRVRMLGHRDDVPEILAGMDVFAHPSLGVEGLPQSLVQAMATGLPVVATPIGAIPEAVIDRVTGCLVPPGDPVALAQTVARLLDDPQERARLGEAARAHVAARFSVETMLDRTEALYRTIVPAQASAPQ